MDNLDFTALTDNLDLAAFWEENEICRKFTTDKPRCSLSFSPDDHWLFEFRNVPSTVRYYHDKAYRDELHRQANNQLNAHIGKTYFDEDTWEHQPRRIENLFGCEFAYHEGGTPWLVPVTDDPDVFSRILDQAERTDIKSWALPEEFLKEWEQRRAAGNALPVLGTGSRGPATIMTSVLKPETFFFWTVDYPHLLGRFRDLLAEKMIEFNLYLRAFSGNQEPGWWITDDNSALFNRRLYREYCYPVLERVLDALAPAGSKRYQHSDSAMGHLLEMQNALGIQEVNYGPEVDVSLIRQKMPNAFIYGQLPPFLLRNGTPEEIRRRVIEDFNKDGSAGGLEITTAGSLAAGTGLGRMRWLMTVVQNDCRYQ